MHPQIVQTDTLKKSADKLPFAPFLNSETLKPKQDITKKQIVPANKKKLEKLGEQGNVLKQTTIPKQATPAITPIQNTVSKQDNKSFSLKKTNDPIDKDSFTIIQKPAAQNIDTIATDTSLTQAKAQSDSTAFYFLDDDVPATFSNVPSQFNSSSKYFSNHLLQNKSEFPLSYSESVPDWFTVVLILIVAGITTIKIFYNKIFKQLFDAFYSVAVTNQVVRDENILVQRASVLLNVIFYGIAALFLYFVSVKYNWSNPFFNDGIFRFFLFAIIIALFYSLKMLVLKTLGFVLEIDKPVAVYIFNIFLINNILGMALIPVVAMLAYLSLEFMVYVVYTGVALVIASFFYRMFRAFSIGSVMSMGSLYYLFIYFCALEIAPVLVLIKLVAR